MRKRRRDADVDDYLVRVCVVCFITFLCFRVSRSKHYSSVRVNADNLRTLGYILLLTQRSDDNKEEEAMVLKGRYMYHDSTVQVQQV